MINKKKNYYVTSSCLLLICLIFTFLILKLNNILPTVIRQNAILMLFEIAYAVALVTILRDIFQYLINNKDISRVTGELFTIIFSFLIFANAGVKCLQISGFDTSKITTIAAFVGILFGIGCKRLIKNILFGVAMAAEDILHPFDFICVKKKYGLVKKIALTHVVIEDGDENLINIPNSDFKEFNNAAFNLSTIIVDAKISVVYPLEKVEALIFEVLANKGENFPIFKQPPEYVGIEKFSNGYMYLRFIGGSKGKDRKKAIISLNQAVLKIFAEMNMDYIYPQKTVEVSNC